MSAVFIVVGAAMCAVVVALGGLCRASFGAIDLYRRNRDAAQGRRHPLPRAHHMDALGRIRRRIVRWGVVGSSGLLCIVVAAAIASLTRTAPPTWLTLTFAVAAALIGALAGVGIGRAYAAKLTRSQQEPSV